MPCDAHAFSPSSCSHRGRYHVAPFEVISPGVDSKYNSQCRKALAYLLLGVSGADLDGSTGDSPLLEEVCPHHPLL
jgi:hypothetical protein